MTRSEALAYLQTVPVELTVLGRPLYRLVMVTLRGSGRVF